MQQNCGKNGRRWWSKEEKRMATHGLPGPKTATLPHDGPLSPAPVQSRPPTPLEVFFAIARAHRISCHHSFEACSVCSLGITCCGCNKLHTAPARLRLWCTICLHYACASCITPFCCSCRKPWFPGDSPTLVLASRFRGGACSTKSFFFFLIESIYSSN